MRNDEGKARTPPRPARVVGRGGAASGRDRPTRCLNCGADRVGPYCHACGQGEVNPDAPVSALVRDGVQDALSWDHRAVRTLRVLLAEPGALARAWAAGWRASFVTPLRLFLMLGAVLVALGLAQDQLAEWLDVSGAGAWQEEGATDRTGRTTRDAAYWAGRTLGELGLNSFLLFTPFVGFAYFVLFNGRRPRLAHHLVHALHLACFGVVGLCAWRFASLGWLLTNPDRTLGDWAGLRGSQSLAAVGALIFTVYAGESIRQFYSASRLKAVLSAPLVVVVPVALTVGLVVVVYLVLLAL